MDEINDRLNELMVHLMESERLHRAYNKYNEYLLYEESRQLQKLKKERDERRRKAWEYRGKVISLNKNLEDKTSSQKETSGKLEKAQTAYKTLIASEVVEKRTELSRLRNEQKNLHKSTDSGARRAQTWKDKQARARKEEIELDKKLGALHDRQLEHLDDLQDLL